MIVARWLRIAITVLGLGYWSPVTAAEYVLYLGNGGTVELPAPKFPETSEHLTVECRFKLFAPVLQPTKLLSQWTEDPKAEDKGQFQLTLLAGNQLAANILSESGGMETVAGKASLELDKWHHLALTWDGSDLNLWLNGQAVATKKPPRFAKLKRSEQPIMIGSVPVKNAKTAPVVKALLANVAVWSTARTAAQLGETQPLSGSETGLVSLVNLSQLTVPEAITEVVSKTTAKVPAGLLRTGWCLTEGWQEPAATGPAQLPLVTYDLTTPAKVAAEGSTAPPALSNPAHMILVSNDKTKQAGVLWQDKSGPIYLTWLDSNFGEHETVSLKSMEDGILAAGTTDPQGNVYYLEIQKVPANREENVPLKAFIRGASPTGKALGEKPLDMSNGKDGFNVWSYGGRWHGSLTYSNGTLALILPRTMYKSGDGLNHQSAIAVVFSAKDPGQFKHLGQITSHSFGNVLSVNSHGEYLGLDLGDCYPRGVHLHKFTASGKTSRVVFTFKTAHATGPRNDSPVYEEISKDGKKYYKWSNDNNTYTELGDVIEGKISYSVLFATERSLEGKVLDNSRAFGNNGDPRDVAMLRVVKDLDKAPGGNEVQDGLMVGPLDMSYKPETGGFYNFAGNWTNQRSTGVIWLTQYGQNESAHAPQPFRLPDGTLLVLWERAAKDGASIQAARVAESGQILAEWSYPNLKLHFNREDHRLTLGDRLLLLAAEPNGSRPRLCILNADLFAGAKSKPIKTTPATPVKPKL